MTWGTGAFATRPVRPAGAGDHDGGTLRRGRARAERALVLGGGGSLGNAWLLGVLGGLSDAGLEVTDADLVVGTSAGATAAAQIMGAPLAELLAAALAPVPARPARSPAHGAATGAAGAVRPAVDHLQRTSEIFAAASGPADLRRRLAASALELGAGDSGRAQWRETVAARLPAHDWPERTVLITAVDARTAEPVVFDRRSGVDLVDAVAASTASGPPYRIGGDRYIDGGYRRSSENADLALGSARVLVLSPLGGRTRAPLDWGLQLAVQVDELRAAGSAVETILPDGRGSELLAGNLMDQARRPAAAEAGRELGIATAPRLADLWQ